MKNPIRTLALSAALLASSTTAGAQVGLDLGTAAPAAQVENLDGTAANLSRWVGRQPVVLQFWATWCSNCRELAPAMTAAHQRYGSRVAFVMVAVSANQSVDRVRAYVERHPMPGVHVYDRRGNAVEAYDVPATSYVVVLDRAGKVVYTGVGGQQDIEAAIRKAL